MARILVVDDDKTLCELYCQTLADHGYDAVTATNGDEALKAVEEGDVDVVVLDIAMPGIDGVEALGRILDIDNQLPVILNTAYASYQQDFMTWAAEDYITKSGDLSDLVESIENILARNENVA